MTENQMALRIQQITGRTLPTCLFCLRCYRGNFQKALEMCSDTSEDGRQG